MLDLSYAPELSADDFAAAAVTLRHTSMLAGVRVYDLELGDAIGALAECARTSTSLTALELSGVLRDGGAYSLGDRRWDISEQVAVAALDVGADDIANSLRKQLEQRFPDSQRVKRLEGHFQAGRNRRYGFALFRRQVI